MTRPLPLLSALALLALLPGCLGGALRGGKPDDLYRFGAAATPAATAATDIGFVPRTVTLQHVHFAPEIADDRLLATQGAKTLYIKGVRWIAPALDLFSQALERTLQARAPEIHLLASRDATAAGYTLDVAITGFEARYDGAGTAAPSVAMEGSATLAAPEDRHVIAFGRFAVTVPASENNSAAIVAAFDAADSRYTAQLADWTRANLATQRR